MNGDLAAQVLDASSDGMFAVDQQARVTLWNRRMEELTGVSREVVLGTELFGCFPAWRQHDEHQRLASALAGVPAISHAFPIEPRDGHRARRFEATYARLGAGALVIVREMSTSDRAVEELRVIDDIFRRRRNHEAQRRTGVRRIAGE